MNEPNDITEEIPMPLWRDRPTNPEPDRYLHVEQLIGGAIMVSHWMMLQEDEETKAMGQRLQDMVRPFILVSD